MLGNMLLTKLQTDLNTLEWDVDIRCDLCRCEFTWGVGDESVAQFERSFVYNWIMALDFLETHTLYENNRLCQCWRAVPKGFDRSRRSFRSHHFGIPWQHDVPSAQNAPGWWRRLTIVRLCSSMFFWYPENDDIALFLSMYCTIFLAIFSGDIPLHRPYGRYLQFRILKFPLILLCILTGDLGRVAKWARAQRISGWWVIIRETPLL